MRKRQSIRELDLTEVISEIVTIFENFNEHIKDSKVNGEFGIDFLD